MKYVIFSDTHLDKQYDEQKMLFLLQIIKGADKVIIAGDFWEGLQFTFDEFIKSKWNVLFPYLKKKNTIYLYGNHDPQALSDKRGSLFSVEQHQQYTFTSGSKRFCVEHGHRKPLLGIIIIATLSKTIAFFTKKNPQIAHQIEKFIIKIFGKSTHQALTKHVSSRIKAQFNNEVDDKTIHICGHSHHQEIDLPHKYIGTGLINFGLGQYIVIEDGNISLKEQNYSNI